MVIEQDLIRVRRNIDPMLFEKAKPLASHLVCRLLLDNISAPRPSRRARIDIQAEFGNANTNTTAIPPVEMRAARKASIDSMDSAGRFYSIGFLTSRARPLRYGARCLLL